MPKNDVKIEWSFDTSIDKVWNAWTDPKIIKKWFGSDPNGIVISASIDLRKNGIFEICFMNSDGKQFTCYGEYLEIQKPYLLIFTWIWLENPLIKEKVVVKLFRNMDMTDMIFEHCDVNETTAHNYNEGWSHTFKKLEIVLKSE